MTHHCSVLAATACELYDCLLTAMSGAGREQRSTCGPPRRPQYLNISWRLQPVAPALIKLLAGIGVQGMLESEESLRMGCAANHTDFETGGEPTSPNTLAGSYACLEGLVGRPELNGRVARIIRWVAAGKCCWNRCTVLYTGGGTADQDRCPANHPPPVPAGRGRAARLHSRTDERGTRGEQSAAIARAGQRGRARAAACVHRERGG